MTCGNWEYKHFWFKKQNFKEKVRSASDFTQICTVLKTIYLTISFDNDALLYLIHCRKLSYGSIIKTPRKWWKIHFNKIKTKYNFRFKYTYTIMYVMWNSNCNQWQILWKFTNFYSMCHLTQQNFQLTLLNGFHMQLILLMYVHTKMHSLLQ